MGRRLQLRTAIAQDVPQYRTFIGSLYAAGDGVGSNVGGSDIGILVGGIA